MKLIVGLGNPGVKYENTRHNAGFMVLDRIAQMTDQSISKKKFEGSYVKTKLRGEDVILLKPETYMNLSGFSVRACMDFFKIDRKDILVIYDDLDTPVGSIRLKTKGSAGGHNGMKSVIGSVLGEDFNRIRVGIGRDPKIKIIDYVLTKFRADEVEDLNKAIDQAAKAALFSLNHTFEQTMNRYNVKPKKAKPKPIPEKAQIFTNNEETATYTLDSHDSKDSKGSKDSKSANCDKDSAANANSVIARSENECPLAEEHVETTYSLSGSEIEMAEFFVESKPESK